MMIDEVLILKKNRDRSYRKKLAVFKKLKKNNQKYVRFYFCFFIYKTIFLTNHVVTVTISSLVSLK